MATIDKSGTAGTTNLASTAAWTGGVIPTSADIARWLTTSLGPGLTGALTVLGIEQQGATANITHSTNTITLGASGFTQTAANNRNWAESGVLAIGAIDQTWSLAFTTAGTSALSIGGAAGLTGTGILSLANNSGTSDPLRAIMTVAGANAGFTGTLRLLTNSCINFNATGCLTGCNIEVNGDGAYLRNVGAHSFGAAGKTLTFNANGKMGNSANLLTCNSAVALGSTQRTITFADDVTFAAALSGTAGVALAKSDTTWAYITLSNASNTLSTASGSFSVGNYIHNFLVCSSGFPLSDARVFDVTGFMRVAQSGIGGFTAPYSFAAGTTFLGTGAIEVCFAAANIVSFPSDSLSGLTGTSDPGTYYAAFMARSGLVLFTSLSFATGRQAYADVKELPARVTFQCTAATNTPGTGRLYYTGAGATYAGTRIDMNLRDDTFPAQNINEIYANCSDANPLIIGGGVKRFGVSATQTLTLRGTSTADNAITGTIDGNSLGALGITKADAGKWVLSGANVHTGVTTVNAGTLAAASTAALGTTGAVTVAGTGQLMLQGGLTVNKSSGAFTVHANNPIVSVGDNTLQTAGITLGGTTTFEVTTGNKLTLANTGAITDGASTFGITKTGAGELQLGDFANTYDGNVSIQAGTLAVTTLNDSGVAGVLGRSTSGLELRSTLRFAGSVAASSTRAIALQGATPTLEATGTAAATYSGTITQTSEARQVVLTGTSTAANALASALGNNSLATGIQKTGTGNWRVTGAMSYTGATDVDQGTLRFERPDGNTMASTVTVDAGAVLELATDTMASSGGTAGRVLGTGNVVVNGIVKTRGGTTQKGQVRYGGNLTFGAGSSLYIGAAA
jgi:autotransporter-associated beta strand protein